MIFRGDVQSQPFLKLLGVNRVPHLKHIQSWPSAPLLLAAYIQRPSWVRKSKELCMTCLLKLLCTTIIDLPFQSWVHSKVKQFKRCWQTGFLEQAVYQWGVGGKVTPLIQDTSDHHNHHQTSGLNPAPLKIRVLPPTSTGSGSKLENKPWAQIPDIRKALILNRVADGTRKSTSNGHYFADELGNWAPRRISEHWAHKTLWVTVMMSVVSRDPLVTVSTPSKPMEKKQTNRAPPGLHSSLQVPVWGLLTWTRLREAKQQGPRRNKAAKWGLWKILEHAPMT